MEQGHLTVDDFDVSEWTGITGGSLHGHFASTRQLQALYANAESAQQLIQSFVWENNVSKLDTRSDQEAE